MHNRKSGEARIRTPPFPQGDCFNVEQQLTGGGTEPSQLGIDRAFKGKCRVTKNIVKVGEQSVRLLNGRNTGAMGVESIHDESPTQTSITNLERTLIDITVRPIYSGGVYMVAQAFENAKQVSIPRLAKYLQRLKYTYPFQQAIGYYLIGQEGIRTKSCNLYANLASTMTSISTTG